MLDLLLQETEQFLAVCFSTFVTKGLTENEKTYIGLYVDCACLDETSARPTSSGNWTNFGSLSTMIENEPAHDKTYNRTCASSENRSVCASVQSGQSLH